MCVWWLGVCGVFVCEGGDVVSVLCVLGVVRLCELCVWFVCV